MPNYHLTVKIKSRGKGNNTIASASYRANEELHDERTDKNFRFRNKEEVQHSEILKPEQAPESFSQREKLWNAVEKNEKRSDARLARELEFSLPKELDQNQQLEMTREFFDKNFVKKNYVVDFSLHNKDGNPHVHGMVTDRQVDKDGNFSKKKDRSMNDKNKIFEWRKSWEEIQNKYLERAGLDERVSCESYEARGIKKIPTIHEGYGKNKIERKKINEEIRKLNQEYEDNQKIIDEEMKKQEELLKKNPAPGPTKQKTRPAPPAGQKFPEEILKKNKWSVDDVGRVADFYFSQIEQGSSLNDIGTHMATHGINIQRIKMIATEMQKKAKAAPQAGAGGSVNVLVNMATQKIQQILQEIIKEHVTSHEELNKKDRIKKCKNN